MPAPRPIALRNLRIAASLGALGLMLAAHWLGILQRFADPAGLAHSLVALGPAGYAAFVLAYTLLQPFGVPGTVFILAAPLIWPWQEAFVLSLVGTMCASVVGFSFARLVARDWLVRWIPPRFQRYEAALERRGFSTVLLLRLVFWMPPLLHAFFGVSRVRFWTHFWGSLAGYIPPLLLVSFFGQRIFDGLRSLPLTGWLALGGALGLAGLAMWGARRLQRRSG